MKYDREEAYLHEKLTGGLHPADVDLWPTVAEHLPDAPPARHPRWKLAICLAAPLLIAAGVIGQEELQKALSIQKQTRERLGKP